MKFKKHWIISLVLIISLQQYATYYAPGLTFDSRQYISAAHSFSERGVFLTEDGNYYVVQPPLYPVVLSLGGDHTLTWASILNMICLVGTLWIMFLLGEALFHYSISRWLYQGSLAFGTPLLLIGNFVWSESLFLLLLTIIWYLLYQYYRHPSISYIGWLILVTNLLCLQRNAGIFFFLMALTVILFKKQKRHIILYAALGGLGFMAWNTYVYQISSGSHNVANQAFFSGMAKDYIAHIPILTAWFFPGKWGIPLFVIWGSAAIGFTYHLYKRKKWEPLQIRIMVAICWICITYIAFIAAMWWELALWDIERYLSVIYPLVMLAAFIIWDKLYAEIGYKKIKVFLVVLSMLWLCYPIVRTVKNVVFWHEVNGKKKEVVSSQMQHFPTL